MMKKKMKILKGIIRKKSKKKTKHLEEAEEEEPEKEKKKKKPKKKDENQEEEEEGNQKKKKSKNKEEEVEEDDEKKKRKSKKKDVEEEENKEDHDEEDHAEEKKILTKEDIEAEAQATLFERYILESGLSTAFQIIFSEICANKIPQEQVFVYTSMRLRQLNEEISQKVAPDSDKIAEPNVASKQMKKEDKVVRQTQEEEDREGEENY